MRSKRSWRGWLAVGLCALSSSACGQGDEQPAKRQPVEGRSGFQPSASEERVRNDLYEYRHPDFPALRGSGTDPDEFAVTDAPPLSFNFPRTYYSENINHRGDAVILVGIHLDRNTWTPMGGVRKTERDAVVRRVRGRPGAAAAIIRHDRDVDRRTIYVKIYSNLLRRARVRGGQPTSAAHDRDLAKGGGFLIDVRADEGRAARIRKDTRETVTLGEVDISGVGLEAIPEDTENSLIHRIRCLEYAPKCKVEFIYQNRAATATLYRQDLSVSEEYIRNIKRVLDMHRIPAPLE